MDAKDLRCSIWPFHPVVALTVTTNSTAHGREAIMRREEMQGRATSAGESQFSKFSKLNSLVPFRPRGYLITAILMTSHTRTHTHTHTHTHTQTDRHTHTHAHEHINRTRLNPGQMSVLLSTFMAHTSSSRHYSHTSHNLTDQQHLTSYTMGTCSNE